MRFFRELSDHLEAGQRVEEDELVLPGTVARRPVPIEPDPQPEDEGVEYVKRERSAIFKVSRDDLPRWFIDPRIEVRQTSHMGKGCFALEDIEKNTLIESAPVILVHGDTFMNLNQANGGIHKLSEYPFSWGRDGMCAIALGFGGIYNHSPDPSVTWRPSYEHESIQYTTSRYIKKGEEIFIRYLPLDRLDSLWFSDPASEEAANVWRREKGQMMGDIKTWKGFGPQ